MLIRGEDFERAIAMVRTAIAAPLDTPDMTLGYFLLADLYNRVGDAQQAQQWADRGAALRQQDVP
jgi:hypothetical protein